MNNKIISLNDNDFSIYIENLLKDVINSQKVKFIRKYNIEIYNELLKRTQFLDKFENINQKQPNISILERIYCLKNNLVDRPKCITCGLNYVNYNFKYHGYPKHCSKKCEQNDLNVINKRRKTNLKKYGHICAIHNSEIEKKANESRKKTFIERYGVEHYSKTQEYKDKSKQTCLDRYGVDNYSKTDDSKNRCIENNRKKYGVDYFFQSQEYKDKTAKTNLEKYGHKCSLQNRDVIEKSKQYCLQKYGVDSYSKSNEFSHKLKTIYAKKYYEKLCNDNLTIPMFSEIELIKNYIEADCPNNRKALLFKCLKCGNIFEETLNDNFQTNRQHARCLNCFPINSNISKEEKDLVEFIKTIYNGEIIENSREIINNIDNDGFVHWYELDVYLPKLHLNITENFGIERVIQNQLVII